NNYYEPFLGSGAVMAQLLYQSSTTNTPIFSHSYASDILPFLIDIFNIVKYDPQQIKNYYANEIEEYYRNPNDKYNEIRVRFNKDYYAHDFCLLSRTCYSGIIRFRKADGYMSTHKRTHNPIMP